jgi:hypothetical protein
MKRLFHILSYAFCTATLLTVFCQCSYSGTDYTREHEDKEAKEMLQGVWVNDEEGAPALMARGDSLFFPDGASLPVAFWIYKDSLYTQGNTTNQYLITKQAEHLFKFFNKAGDEIKLVRNDDKQLIPLFTQARPYAQNIFRTTDLDTIADGGLRHYDCNLHIEPTSDRVFKPTFNNEGIEVDNLYLDNVARLRVSTKGVSIFSHDFRKQEFSSFVPAEFMKQSILRDVVYDKADTAAVYFDAVIGIPDAASCYVVELKISKDGRLTKKLK